MGLGNDYAQDCKTYKGTLPKHWRRLTQLWIW